MTHKILVTATPPTTNGDLHLGHLSGPYLGADVLTRAQRLFGHEVLYISSTDDNQSYLMTKAHQEKRTAMEVIEDYSAKIRKSIDSIQIEMNVFTSPLNELHNNRVQQFFLKLFNEGKLETRITPTCYCEACQRFLFEAYVNGGCPTCGKSSGGQNCEECGHPNNPIELINPKCTLCGTVPVIREFKGIWFPIEPYRHELEQYYKDYSGEWRPHLRCFFKELLNYKELPSFLVSNPSSWGISVPVEGFEDQVINVWFEMVPGEIQSTAAAEGYDEGKVDSWWKPNGDVSLVQFFGFDNSLYYSFFHTAMLIAHGEYRTASTFINNEFYLLEHKKFSTSRKHAIWGSEFVNETNSDWVRYHLCLTNPELEQTNFSVEQFQQTVNGQTLQNWKALCSHALIILEQDKPHSMQPSSQIIECLNSFDAKFRCYYSPNTFTLRGAAVELDTYIKEGLRLLTDSRSVADAHAILRGLCLFSLPITPSFGKKLYELLFESSVMPSWNLYPEVFFDAALSSGEMLLRSFPKTIQEIH